MKKMGYLNKLGLDGIVILIYLTKSKLANVSLAMDFIGWLL